MQRITVAIMDETKERVYLEEPYMDIPKASTIYYPEVSHAVLIELRTSSPKRIQELLSMTATC